MHIFLQTNNVIKYFPIKSGIFSRETDRVQAVRGVTLTIHKGETLGLVGESGCGKTTLGRVILMLYKPDSGEIFFKGENIVEYGRKDLRRIRKDMQMIFQDPYSSLNPRMKVGNIVGEALTIHNLAHGKEKTEKVIRLLEIVGLRKDVMDKYPHEFSGGQRQRIGIARALAVNPEFIICDEPVSALDVSIQAQVINLLQDLQEQFHLTYLFISHDLKVVEHISNRIAVMYLGKIMELMESRKIFTESLHPYTKALISAIPIIDPQKRVKRIILEGEVPSPIHPPSGCPFHTRCPLAEARCKATEPELREVEPNHFVACHLV